MPPHSPLVYAVTALCVVTSLVAQDQQQVTAALQKLQSGADAETQLQVLQSIATSLDPRIPAACLPLLQSPGTSVRRNAARAIGSRWHQIPPEQLDGYVQALKINATSDNPGLVNMTDRGIGLLLHRYGSEMFSQSPNKRWVIYERHGKPCLIDTRNQSEELLGFALPGFFSPALGNESLTRDCRWHPKQEMIAMQIIIFRHIREVWVWRNGGGLRPILTQELQALLKPASGRFGTGVYANIQDWKGNALELSVEYAIVDGDKMIDHTAQVRWDSKTDQLSLLSDKKSD